MDSVLRAAAMYVALMILFKIAGRRSLAELTTFDFVLLMIIGEATQQALLGDDFSLTNSIVVIVTLIAVDVGLSSVETTLFDHLQAYRWRTHNPRRARQDSARTSASCTLDRSRPHGGGTLKPRHRDSRGNQIRDT